MWRMKKAPVRNGASLDHCNPGRVPSVSRNRSPVETSFDRRSRGCFDLQRNWSCGFSVNVVTHKLLRRIRKLWKRIYGVCRCRGAGTAIRKRSIINLREVNSVPDNLSNNLVTKKERKMFSLVIGSTWTRKIFKCSSCGFIGGIYKSPVWDSTYENTR